MSRRSKRVDSYRRDASDITRSPVDSDPVYTYREINPPRDRRSFHPDVPQIPWEPRQPSFLYSVQRAFDVHHHYERGYDIYNPIHYISHSRETVVCLKRKLRREILFAKGRGGGRHKKPRYTRESAIKCRR